MLLKTASLWLWAIAAVYALPASVLHSISDYVVKERHIVPRGWTEVGPASKSNGIHLQIGLKQRNEGVVEQHLLEISDPNHARYGQHLLPGEIHDIVRPSDECVQLVHAWLLEHGIADALYSPANDWISVFLSIGKAEVLLQTEYKIFKHEEDGDVVVRAPVWSLPQYLHEHIDVVQPTTSFFRTEEKNTVDNIRQQGEEDDQDSFEDVDIEKRQTDPIFDVCSLRLTSPRCLRTLYGTLHYTPQATVKNGIGITNYLNQTSRRDDIQLYLKTYRPEIAKTGYAYKFPIININNAPNHQGPLSKKVISMFGQFEGVIDAELALLAYPTPMTSWLIGGSPPWNPDLQTAENTNEPYMTFLNYALAQDDLPPVISNSYADDEQTVPESYARRICAGYAQLGARGISVLHSSGDFGVGPTRNCLSNSGSQERMFLPAFPPTCPWVTAVGATKGFSPEVAVTYLGSGAGFSNYFKAPAYQKSTVDAYVASLNGLHEGVYNPAGRAYPDVAAQGNKIAFGWADRITWNGGTSAACPLFSAVIALVNDALLAKGHPTLGFLNPWLYGGAYKALTDIKSGSSFGCNSTGFPAQDGWDAVTGWGTPNFKKLVEAAFAQYGEEWDGEGLEEA